MKHLLTAVQKRLANAANIQDYPQTRKNNRLFEYVDVDWGQCDFFGEYPPPVKFPCALLDIVSANYANVANKMQTGAILLQVRIIDVILNNSSYQAPDNQKIRAFAVFDLIAETNRLLHAWADEPIKKNTGNFGPLTKQSISKINRQDGLREYRLIFNVQLTDVSAVPAVLTVPPPKIRIATELV